MLPTFEKPGRQVLRQVAAHEREQRLASDGVRTSKSESRTVLSHA